MIVKILGGIDIIIGLVLILFGAGIGLNKSMLIFFGLVLIAKATLGFFKDFASWIDVSGATVFFLSIIVHVPGLVSIIIGFVIIQKGIVSFL